jgi:hypothetical protein
MLNSGDDARAWKMRALSHEEVEMVVGNLFMRPLDRRKKLRGETHES